jgi:hypothetical protein
MGANIYPAQPSVMEASLLKETTRNGWNNSECVGFAYGGFKTLQHVDIPTIQHDTDVGS